MKVNNAELASLADRCFDLSMDGDVQPSDQKNFLVLGKRLRGSLVNLLTAEFQEGTQAVVNANNQITTLNQTISDATQVLNNTTQIINQINQLVNILDDLLKIASNFK